MDPVGSELQNNDKLLGEYIEIKEGKAKILFPKQNTVFYNKVQVFNRDLSISIIKYFIRLYEHNKKKPASEEDYETIKYASALKDETNSYKDDGDNSRSYIDDNMEGMINEDNKYDGDNVYDVDNKHSSDNTSPSKINILEALSATGLRAIRYALEIPSVNKIIANDLSRQAVTNIERNIKHNCVEDIVESKNADASMLLYQHRFPQSKRFQVIDLDPYGSPCQFLDGALQAIDDGGLLCVTCTDMGALCGNHGEAAYAKYGSVPFRTKYCHEMALRIVLACLDSHAGRYKRYIQPLISLSADFYIRLFVRVFTSASEVKRSASKKSYVFHCNGCETYTLQPMGFCLEDGDSKKYKPGTGPVVGKRCEDCGYTFKIGGPIWSQPMHDSAFINGLLASIQGDGKECYQTYERIIGVLTLMSEELEDRPLYLVLDNLCNIIHCPTPSKSQFYSAILHAGYKVSGTHANVAGFKTDAPNSVIWDILRCWFKTTLVKDRKNIERTPTYALLSKEPLLSANFEIHQQAIPQSKLMKITRYPLNPEVDWGPKARAKQGNRFTSLTDKRKDLQGKRVRGVQKQDNKQFVCKRFKRGVCKFSDDDCKFSHQIEDSRQSETSRHIEVERNRDSHSPIEDESTDTSDFHSAIKIENTNIPNIELAPKEIK